MKKLILVWISLALFAGKGAAQYAGNVPSRAELKIRMSLDDPRLYRKYKTGRTLSGIGAGLTIGGMTAMVVGIFTVDKETVSNVASAQANLSDSNTTIFSVGTACILAGTPLWIIGSTKKRKARNTYLREHGYGTNIPDQPSPYLQLNTAPKGLGLAFVF